MALNELKQTEADLREYGVQSAPDKLSGSAADNKKIFDRLFQNVGMSKFNLLLDYLLDGTAAAEMGVLSIPELGSAKTVQAALEALVQGIRDVSQGAVAGGSITTEKIADMAVTGPKLAARSVSTAKIALEAIITELLADEAVTEEKIARLAITTALLADKSVVEEKIADAAVTARKLGVGSVETGKIAGGAVTLPKLGSDVTADALGGAVVKTFTADVDTGWTGSAAPYSKAVTISGLLANDTPIVDLVASSTYSDAEAQIEAWGYVYRAVTSANTLTLYATEKPTVAMTIQVKVVR